MVGLNGSALPDQDFNPSELNGSHALTSAKDPQPRRVRSSQTSRGPKPLLPRSLKEALQLAELLSKSKLIPKGFETPETCLVGILYGMEVGLSPIAALQRMAVIDGRPTIWGDAALALVQASGLLQSIREEVVEDQHSETIKALTAICTVRREGRSEPIIGTFSVEDAKRAGLWHKPGPWTDYPKRMLTMRARAFALRDAFPDVLAGLYIREEFEGAEKQYERRSSSGECVFPLPQDKRQHDAEWDQAEAAERFGRTKPNLGSDPNHLSDLPRDTNGQHATRRAPPPPPAPSLTEEAEKPSGTVDLVSVSTNGLTDHVVLTPHDPQMPAVVSEYDSEIIHASEETIDPETLLDLLDSALCCALDLSTLEEIVDDFAERLRPLSKDHHRKAQKIIDRHQRRVEDLDRLAPSKSDASRVEGTDVEISAVDEIAKDTLTLPDIHADATACDPAKARSGAYDSLKSATNMPRGLKALLPSLGLGALPMAVRRRKHQRSATRSLASWNAHYRLPEFKFRSRDEDEIQSDQAESGE